MDMNEPEGRADGVDPNAAKDETVAVFPEILPADYWSVNKKTPAATNNDLSESRWKQVSYLIQVWWNRIADDEVAGIEGKTTRLASLLQQRYGYTEYHAESQSIRWMRQHRDEQEIAP